jgi:hypothetical protein
MVGAIRNVQVPGPPVWGLGVRLSQPVKIYCNETASEGPWSSRSISGEIVSPVEKKKNK